MYWYEDTSKNDVVLSTRVRFARNLAGIPFPDALDDKGRREVCDRASKAFDGWERFDFEKLGETEKNAYTETHLCSPQFASSDRKGRILLVGEGGAVSVMVNEEDHFRIQAIVSGLDPQRAFDLACAADDRLSSEKIAFSDRLGYLTACPTNLGCAMRISAMLHLPALSGAGELRRLAAGADQLGFTLRGAFGEGSDSLGDLYQISNKSSFDGSEQDIIKAFSKVIGQITEAEMKLRKQAAKDSIELEDRVWRSFGVLSHARSVSYGEFARCWSDLRLGVTVGIIDKPDLAVLDRLLVELMPARLCLRDMSAADPAKRDALRAELLRKEFN